MLEVYGTPQPQGNKTAFVRGGRAVLVEGRRPDARAAFHDWRTAISAAARAHQHDHEHGLLDTPCTIEISFRLPRPKSAPKRRLWPDSRPDIDKLTRAVLDAITGTLITNDSRVVHVTATKRFAGDRPPGATITIRQLEPAP